MNELITITEASNILDVTLTTVSYYIRTGKLPSIETDRRTAHRRPKKLVRRADVLELRRAYTPDPAPTN